MNSKTYEQWLEENKEKLYAKYLYEQTRCNDMSGTQFHCTNKAIKHGICPKHLNEAFRK